MKYSPDQLQTARGFGAVTGNDNGIAYIEWLAGPQGCGFALLREPHHTDEDIAHAKRWLKDSRDVVTVEVRRPE